MADLLGLGADPDDPAWAHLLVEAWRAVGHDRPDVLFDGADGAALLAPERLAAAAARISAAEAAAPDVGPGRGTVDPATSRLGDGDTTHLCAIDADGLGVSLTQSNALDFGSHLVEPATGIFLHNRGVGFSLLEGHPAEVGPGRRPPHTLSPMLVTGAGGELTHLVGAMGGDQQPQIISQLLARLLRAGQDPATAVAAARLVLDAPSAGPFRLWWGDDLSVLVEADAPAGWAEGLAGARAPRARHPCLRPGRRRLRPGRHHAPRRPGRAALRRRVGPAQPRRGGRHPLTACRGHRGGG